MLATVWEYKEVFLKVYCRGITNLSFQLDQYELEHILVLLRVLNKTAWKYYSFLNPLKVLMQGKLFQRCTHFLYCGVLSLGGNVNTRRMSKPDMGSIFHIKDQWNILVIGNYYVNYQNYQNLMLITSSDTKRTLMHLILFTNSAQRELASIWTQSIRNCN